MNRMQRYSMAFVVLATLAAPQLSLADKTLKVATKADEMAFSPVKLTAKAGEKLSVVFTNSASKSSGLQHDWVLVTPGKEQDVATAGMTAGPDKGYAPDSPDVLAKSKLLQPGEKDTVSFVAPKKPGDYPYICTFPGHFPSMRGTLTVK